MLELSPEGHRTPLGVTNCVGCQWGASRVPAARSTALRSAPFSPAPSQNLAPSATTTAFCLSGVMALLAKSRAEPPRPVLGFKNSPGNVVGDVSSEDAN